MIWLIICLGWLIVSPLVGWLVGSSIKLAEMYRPRG